MPIDVKLDTAGDITIPTRIARGEDLVIQKVRGRSETHLGEWILDSRDGVPWLRWLDQTPIPETQIEDFLKAEYEEIAGVRRADVTVTPNAYQTSADISVQIYLDQDDAPDFRLDVSIAADEPAVFRITRLSTVF